MTRPIPTDWQSPTDLRCVGGPADGKWFAVPPAGYAFEEARGGAVWHYTAHLTASDWLRLANVANTIPRSALPDESV